MEAPRSAPPSRLRSEGARGGSRTKNCLDLSSEDKRGHSVSPGIAEKQNTLAMSSAGQDVDDILDKVKLGGGEQVMVAKG